MGIREYQSELSRNPKQSFEETKQLSRKLQVALGEMKLIEGQTTLDVLEILREKGCWVFGLTSRYSEMATVTNKVLNELGICFANMAPFPKGSVLRDPGTGAVCSDGIIYSNAIDKGVILNRFLQNVVFQDCLQSQPQRPNPALARAKYLPPQIIFVDDRIENVESVARGLHVCSRDQLDIPVTSLYYRALAVEANLERNLSALETATSCQWSLPPPAAAADDAVKWMDVQSMRQLPGVPPPCESDLSVARVQIDHFVSTNELLDNEQARAILNMG